MWWWLLAWLVLSALLAVPVAAILGGEIDK